MSPRWTVVLLAVSSVWLQAAAARAGLQTSPQTAVIQGTVTRAGTGQALKRARVNLRRAIGNMSGIVAPTAMAIGSLQAVTDDTGHFVFNNVTPGDYRISADREGFIHQEYGARSFKGQGMTISVVGGQQLANIDFQMTPTGSISGRILDESGEPMANVQVQAETFTYQQGKRILMMSGQAGQTNDLGEYRIYWLTPGEYYVTATSRRPPNATVNPVVSQQVQISRMAAGGGVIVQAGPIQSTEAYAPTYFPGGGFVDSATPVPVPAGSDVRGIDFVIHPTRTVTVKGQVIVPLVSASEGSKTPSIAGDRAISGPGIPVGPQMQVMLARATSSETVSVGAGVAMRGANMHPDGSFEISNVIPGSYILGAFGQQNGQQFSARLAIDVSDRGLENVNVPLRPGVSMPGRVYVDGSLPSGYKLSQIRVMLQPDELTMPPMPGPRGGNVQISDDGSFTLTNVTPMSYRVRLAGLPSGAYLMAGRIGSEDAVNRPFTISGDQDVSLQLQIGFSTGKVSGTAVDDKGLPFPGALATLVPDEPARLRTDLYFSVPTDQYGRFSFSNVPAGSYKVFAWEDMSDAAYQDPEFIHRYEARGVSVKVDNGSAVEQQVGVVRQ
jgi:hypothetical protein